VGVDLSEAGGLSAGSRLAVEQARWVANLSGAHVTLLERRDSLGGQFSLAPLTTGKDAMARPLQSLISMVERIGVEVRTGIDATVDVITGLQPDHTIVATGSSPFIPPIPAWP